MMKKDLVIVLFGSTGDLTYRKLMPALTKLYKDNHLDHNFEVIAVGRRDYDNQGYMDYMLEHNSELDTKTILKFTNYYKMQITDEIDYIGLKQYINSISNENARVISYMAVAPYFFMDVSRNISTSNIIEKGNKNHSVIFEKPFGNSLTSASELNRELWKLFSEEQIYRIDNYLAKKIVQQILKLRFEVPMFEKSWNNKSIKCIKILIKESIGIVGRGAFYEETGALRDMVQSHLLHLLTLVTMDRPKSFDASDIKDAKVKVLKSLKLKNDNILLGQYDGYLDEEEVDSNSNTETLAFLQLEVKSKLLKEVPIYLFTGKALDEKSSKIVIEYNDKNDDLHLQQLIIEFAPKDQVLFKTKISTEDITNTIIDKKEAETMIDDYDKLLYDAINHDSKLFVRWDEVEASWKFIDDVYKLDKKVVKYSGFTDIEKSLNFLFND